MSDFKYQTGKLAQVLYSLMCSQWRVFQVEDVRTGVKRQILLD